MLNLAMLLEDSARRRPDTDAVRLGERRTTYAGLNARAAQVANLLVEWGVKPGDAVALTCPNLPDFPAVYFGILKAGAVVVPLNILLKPAEIAYHLQDSGAAIYICFEGSAELPTGEFGVDAFAQVPGCHDMFVITADSAAPSPYPGIETLDRALASQPTTFDTVPRRPDDTAVILYTSGTTGKPKGAELTHANMVLNAVTANRLFDSGPDRADTHLVTLPLFHSFGQTIDMNAGLSTGATLVMMPRFDAVAALRLMVDEHVTFFAGVPTMYWSLLHAIDDGIDTGRLAATLRRAVSGGAALPIEIHARFAQRFGVRILEGYGMSETSPLAIFADPEREPRPGSIGVPVWGIEARLIDSEWNTLTGDDAVGEIAIRGHNVMKGYLNRPEANREAMRDGWLRTGDLARRDRDGFYYIVDRAKDMIVRGGFNVYPREIEEVLLTYPGVSLAAVIGIPDDHYGEEIVAFVVPEGSARPDPGEMIAWCRERLAAYKYPRRIEFTDALPMTASGKILKRELRIPDRPVPAGSDH
ncbi:long-chain-fatty-acid--CoA ligase [Nocardia africana]|uniref:Long-chain-fatty-acid--CoA ligase n=1 Tax=Nocardia africana TaxID=134964 RepID=A0A378X5F0_9NOCA|nr:long-chain fatty acid--CoA ligase [Nocardia africana]MCC3317251.1 long-chain fatty acid--CoA ligase [Nocardia africana]SUA47984.1 Long-chain-fatty-acid--CoA ligase [Nocardia africana]